VSVFCSKLGILEAVVKYIKENFDLTYSEIADLLNRDQRTIWNVYNDVKNYKISIEDSFFIPVSIFSERTLGPLEALTLFLKEKNFKNAEIAKLIDRDRRNIFTVWKRALKKRGDAS